jgi:hypothetical protein
MDGKSLLEHVSGLQDSLRKYLETKLSYYRLLAFEKAARLITAFLGNGVIIVALLIALLFLSGAGAVYIGTLLESQELGLLITGAFYLLLALVLIIFRNKIFGPFIIRSLADVLFQDDDEDDEK